MAGACHHGGACVDKIGGFECQCPPGFVGPRCEGDVNECLSDPCSPAGTLNCVQLVNNYRCHCKAGFMGRHCELKINFCEASPCNNGGICTSTETGHTCACPPGFSGKNCDPNSECDSNPCENGATCRPYQQGFLCTCPPGLSGSRCQIDDYDECQDNPCKNNGICRVSLFYPSIRIATPVSKRISRLIDGWFRVQDRAGRYDCNCPATWNGQQCEVYDPNFPGGIGRKTPWQPAISTDLQREKIQCAVNLCHKKSSNGICDEECNTLGKNGSNRIEKKSKFN